MTNQDTVQDTARAILQFIFRRSNSELAFILESGLPYAVFETLVEDADLLEIVEDCCETKPYSGYTPTVLTAGSIDELYVARGLWLLAQSLYQNGHHADLDEWSSDGFPFELKEVEETELYDRCGDERSIPLLSRTVEKGKLLGLAILAG